MHGSSCSTRKALTRMIERAAELGHPIIDADGHQLEYLPLLDRYVREEMPAGTFEKWRRRQAERPAPLSVRRATRQARQGWWTGAEAAAIEDRAAAMLPRL